MKFINQKIESTLSLIANLIIRTVYSFNVHGLEKVKNNRPALYVCSHYSWIDALFITAALKRPVRFIMSRDRYNAPLVKSLMKLFRVIPESHTDGPRAIQGSIQAARKALDSGESVCIFPEGAISLSGFLGKIKKGYRRIVEDSSYPVIPVHIDGSWGSSFSYYGGKLFYRFPSFKKHTVRVIFGEPCKPDVEPDEVRIKLQELAADSFNYKKKERKSLAYNFIASARRNRRDMAMNDTTGKQLSFGKTLIGSIILADILKKRYKNEQMIGILLPATVGGALVNIACTLAQKIPVNINFTASTKLIQSVISQCNLRTIITSKKFIAKLNRTDLPDSMIFVEDILKSVTSRQKVAAMVKALFFPKAVLAGEKTFSPDSCATILFSSGSTAEPKGIVLSHHNIISNIESLNYAITLGKTDGMCAALPFFHSFGFTATLWFPILTGFKVSYHPNPLDGENIAKVVRKNRSTILMATPTFLKTYVRKATKEDFQTLRLVVVGAEKLKKNLSDKFYEKFAVRPVEGFGATELSPVASLNVPDVTIGKKHCIGNKEGTIGRPLYGVAVKIVDPDTGEKVQNGKPGLLLVKGPNVMERYLHQPKRTLEVIRDGWYNTGDIAKIDEDGFLTLTDRLSRFSKIGGEMIPHGALEEIIQNEMNTDDQVAAVTAIPDETRGDKLIVLYTPEAGGEENLKLILDNADIPNLWKPGHDAYYQIDEIPVLGSGKIDLKALKQIAAQKSEARVLEMAA